MSHNGRTDTKWLTSGSLLVSIPLCLYAITPAMEPWAPLPLPVLMLLLMVGPAALFLVPVLYVGATLILVKSTKPGTMVLLEAMGFVMLNSAYLASSYSYGLQWQGLTHTYVVVALNVLLLIAISALALQASRSHSRSLALTTNLLVFFATAWCAFPYLGETP